MIDTLVRVYPMIAGILYAIVGVLAAMERTQ